MHQEIQFHKDDKNFWVYSPYALVLTEFELPLPNR